MVMVDGRHFSSAPEQVRRVPDAAGAWAVSWLVPLAGAWWAAWHLRRSYFFYDEWSLIERVLHTTPADGMMASFNGHLWMLQYWIYRVQVFWFGLDDHTFVSLALMGALLALHVSLAALLRASGLSRVSSTLVGGLLTYLGVASQDIVFAVQASTVLAMAAGVAASAVALAHRPSVARAALVGVLMLVSVGLDSGTALLAVTLASCVTLLAWRGIARLAIAPAIVALGLWALVGDRGPSFHADLQTRAAFAGQLLLTSAGGLVGRGSTVGAVVFAAVATVIVSGARRGDLDARTRIMLAAGSVATLVVVGALAHMRAGVPDINFVDYNRYLHMVAIPLALAAAPALAATGRGWVLGSALAARLPAVRLAGPVLVVAAFLLGIPPMHAYTAVFQRYNDATRAGVASAAAVIRAGCPPGTTPDEAAQPLGQIGPQLSTGLLRELVEGGFLTTTAPAPSDPAVVARMCPARRGQPLTGR